MITLKHISKTVFAVAILTCFALCSTASAAIFTDGFNANSADQDNTQYITTFAVQHQATYDNWTMSVFTDGHLVDLNPANAAMCCSNPENLPNPNQWAAMLLLNQVLTSNANITANTNGTQYTVDFLAGPAAYGDAQSSQRSQTIHGNGLRIEVIDNNGAGAVIGTTDFFDVDFDTNASALDLGLSNGGFNYTGSGVGDVKLRITGLGGNVFQGSIDEISISEASAGVIPEPGTIVLAALALVGLIGSRWRRRR